MLLRHRKGIGWKRQIAFLYSPQKFGEWWIEEYQMGRGTDGLRPRACLITFSATEEPELEDNVAPQSQYALRQVQLHALHGLSPLRIGAISDDASHPDVGRQKYGWPFRFQASRNGRLA